MAQHRPVAAVEGTRGYTRRCPRRHPSPPYSCAARTQGGHTETVRLLIKYGADIRARNLDNQAPFDLGSLDMVKLLLSSGAADDSSGHGSAGGPAHGTDGHHHCHLATRGRPTSSGGGSGVGSLSSTGRRGSRSPRDGPGGGGGGSQPYSPAMPYSPAVQPLPLDALGLGGPFLAGTSSGPNSGPQFRPVPPGQPATGSRPRSHRSSRNGDDVNGGGGTGGGDAGPGNCSPLWSPMSADDTAPPPPPQLQLPRGVQQQLLQGVRQNDIMTAYQEDDREIVRRSVGWGLGGRLIDRMAGRGCRRLAGRGRARASLAMVGCRCEVAYAYVDPLSE